MITFDAGEQERKISQLRKREAEDTAKILAGKFNIPYADLASVPINVDALGIVPEDDARAGELAVIQKTGRTLDVGVRNPDAPKTRAVLAALENKNFRVSAFLVSEDSLEKAWSFYQNVARRSKVISGEVQLSSERLDEFRKEVRALSDVQKILGNVREKRTSDILEIILAGAIELAASDVHLEPQAEMVRVRYRLDGMLYDAASLPAAAYRFVLSRVKLISEIKLNVQARGQDGRFTIKVDGAEIEVRVSTLPGPYGENIVLRILNPDSIAVGFGELGMQPWVREIVARELLKPNGMILTTGPTGSGKTTTLYAFIREVHKPDIKIITLEDPIEYHLPGIEQTQVNSASGYDFASGLRSILRQDPDVILVGEIRDLETAKTAMHAALTGHLVFSTLHTNNAAGTIPRLLDLGVDPAIMAPAINVAMAQRLVRKLCPSCRAQKAAAPEEERAIRQAVADLPPAIQKPDLPSPLKIFSAAGCSQCAEGYKGRTGVYEIIVVDDVIEQLIFKKPSEVDVKAAAKAQNQITMRQDGILKALAGVTDLAEVERVVGGG